MNLSMNLQVRQSQSLTMTPQLLQSIRLLQFHHVELLAFLQREADANPLLELVAPAEVAPPPPPAEPALPAADPVPLSGWQDDGSAFRDGAGPEGERHPDAADRLLDARGMGSAAPGPDAGSWEDRIGEDAPSLHAHALAEIAEVFPQGEERRLAELWFADLDASGFLDADLGLPADLLPLLVRLQDEAEPAGLFARSLEDCLAIQLRRQDRFDPVMATVVANLPLLAKRDFAALSRLTGESEAELLDILARSAARSAAGLRLLARAPAVVVPDAVVTREAARRTAGGCRSTRKPSRAFGCIWSVAGRRAPRSARSSPSAGSPPAGCSARSRGVRARSSRSPTRSCASRAPSCRAAAAI